MAKKKGKLKSKDPFGDDEIIEELTIDVLKRLSGSKLSLDSTYLDLSDPRFQLRNLDGFKDSKMLSLEKLLDINLTRNKLKEINVLTLFRSLRRITASENEILSCDLQLEKLTELDLSYNKLQVIPNLARLPRLEKLFLQYNLITNVGNEVAAVKQTLELLNLSNNKITFNSGGALQRFIDVLRTMNTLKIIDVDKNPFNDIFDRYKDHFILAITTLEQIDKAVITPAQLKELKADLTLPKLSDQVVIGFLLILLKKVEILRNTLENCTP